MADINGECPVCGDTFGVGDTVVRVEIVDIEKSHSVQISEMGMYAHLNCEEE